MKIFIVRHGQTFSNVNGIIQGQNKDSGLTKVGIAQAKRIGKRLKETVFHNLYTSDLGRAIQTTEIINKYTKCENVETNAFLQERKFGILEGMTLKEINEKYSRENFPWRNNFKDAPPNGESIDSVINRVQLFVNFLLSKSKEDSNILIVTHGGIVRALVLSILGLNTDFWNNFNFKNGSITAFEIKDRPVLLFANDTYHLDVSKEDFEGDEVDNKALNEECAVSNILTISEQ